MKDHGLIMYWLGILMGGVLSFSILSFLPKEPNIISCNTGTNTYHIDISNNVVEIESENDIKLFKDFNDMNKWIDVNTLRDSRISNWEIYNLIKNYSYVTDYKTHIGLSIVNPYTNASQEIYMNDEDIDKNGFKYHYFTD